MAQSPTCSLEETTHDRLHGGDGSSCHWRIEGQCYARQHEIVLRVHGVVPLAVKQLRKGKDNKEEAEVVRGRLRVGTPAARFSQAMRAFGR